MTSSNKPIRVVLTMGDPAGIGPEVLLKSLASFKDFGTGDSFCVIGDLRWLRALAGRMRVRVPWGRCAWVDLANVPAGMRPGRLQPAAGKAAYEYLREAVRRIRAGEADALVTAPVSKEAIIKAGVSWIGHTEFLAQAFHTRTVMMFVTGSFRVSVVTTHVSLRDLPDRIRPAVVAETIRATIQTLQRDFGIRKPKVGVAALNPHGGEGGIFGQEEKKILYPVVRQFPQARGPFPSDSLMKSARDGAYDAVVALYHDQALIPIKLIGWEQAVNVTLGLPFVRTSPVHGTAFDIAGQYRADAGSMQAALRLAVQLARQRVQ